MQQVPGISKIVFKGISGTSFPSDVTIDGNYIANEGEILRTVLGQTTAKGGTRHQGNQSHEFDIHCMDFDQKSALQNHKNEFGAVEIFSIDDENTPVMTLPNQNPFIGDRVNFDPSDESGAYYIITLQGVNPID